MGGWNKNVLGGGATMLAATAAGDREWLRWEEAAAMTRLTMRRRQMALLLRKEDGGQQQGGGGAGELQQRRHPGAGASPARCVVRGAWCAWSACLLLAACCLLLLPFPLHQRGGGVGLAMNDATAAGQSQAVATGRAGAATLMDALR